MAGHVRTISATRHGWKKRYFITVSDQLVMFSMFLIDRGTNDIFVLERRFIFIAKAFEVSNKRTNADRFRREFYDFLSLADFSRTQAK